MADSLSRLPLAPGNEVPDLANFTRDDSENSVSRDFVVTKTETSGHYQIQLGNGPEEHREVLPSAEEGADVTDSILGHDGSNSSHLQRRELMGLKQSSTEFSTQVQKEREASSLLTRLKELVMGKQEQHNRQNRSRRRSQSPGSSFQRKQRRRTHGSRSTRMTSTPLASFALFRAPQPLQFTLRSAPIGSTTTRSSERALELGCASGRKARRMVSSCSVFIPMVA